MRHPPDALDTILSITAEAAEIPKKHFRAPLDVIHKHDDSPVTIADRAAETLIRARLAERFPDHGVFGEEFGREASDSPYLWVIDPIDGTKSFICGAPLYGMLAALLHDGAPVLGVVRLPQLDEAFSGGDGGAWRNGAPIRVSNVTRLNEAFLFVNEGEKLFADRPDAFAALCGAGRLRRLGYDCHPHMLLASGHVDACVDYDLKPYDYMALIPVIEGAGGLITDWDGAPLTLDSDGRVLSAATPALHAEMLELLR